jgi:exo-beta-1,3-glucanase (GH17 family)
VQVAAAGASLAGRIALALAAGALAAAASFACWHAANRPVRVDGLQAAEPLASVSFAPFRRHQSPLAGRFPGTAEIEQDLALLAGKVRSVRTYTATEGLEAVPRLAAKYGIAVTHSAWLSFDRQRNEVEVAALIEQANRHPDTIRRVIVGNEALLRGDLKPDQLASLIRRVRQAIRQPVSYADVWEVWVRHPELAKEVDFVTVHFLPYWEDDPVDVAGSMGHIRHVYGLVKRAFPDKPILIGEVGWPSAGRSRERAVPGRAEQARFLAAFAQLAAGEGFDYNVVEAFDQPWKTAHEGTVGGNWGILDAERRAKFAPGRPVTERPLWQAEFAGAAALGMAAMLYAVAHWPGLPGLIALAALGQALAGMLAMAARAGAAQWYDKGALAGPVVLTGLAAALAALLFAETARRLAAPRQPVAFCGPASTLADLGATRWRDWLMLVFLILGSIETWRLALRIDLPGVREWVNALPPGLLSWLHVVLDGRFRDFPIPEFLVATLGFAATTLALALSGRVPAPRPSARPWLDGLLAAQMLAAAALLQLAERFDNAEAKVWGALAIVLALPPLAALLAAWRGGATTRGGSPGAGP